MPIQAKKVVIDNKTYLIKQHPATEGCKLVEEYITAIRAFIIVHQEGTYTFSNKQFVPFIARIESKFLASLIFLDRIANPSAEFEVCGAPEYKAQSKYLTVAEIKAGKTIADRSTDVDKVVQSPLSFSIDYKAAHQHKSVDVDAILAEFFKYITLDGEPVELDSLTMSEVAQMIYAFIEHNVIHIWTKNRWSLPVNYNSGGIAAPRSLESSAKGSSHAAIIYSVLNSELDLATYAELSTCLNVEDAYNMNELAVRQYFESCEMRKESDRQAKSNQ